MGKIRNRKITVRLTEQEAHHLKSQAQLMEMKIEPFVRYIMANGSIIQKPLEEWKTLLRQVSGISNNINQITKRVNSNDCATAEQLVQIHDLQQQIMGILTGL